MNHIVDYETWCPVCKNYKTDESEEPCNDCLAMPVNEDSRKPIKWEHG